MIKKSIFIFLSIVFLASCASERFYPILGSSVGFKKDPDTYVVIKDLTVSGLRVRVTQKRDLSNSCKRGFQHVIELDGPINQDTVYVLDRILGELPDCYNQEGRHVVNTIYLNSSGGRLSDGYEIGRLFRRTGIAAVVEGGKHVHHHAL